MCKYCEDGSIERLTQRTNVKDKVAAFSLIGFKEDGSKELLVSVEDTAVFALQVNYCPMCGRKLNKGE